MSAGVIVGTIRTMDPERPSAEALAWRDGRIIAVGSRAEVLDAAGGVPCIEVGEATVLPGFIDAHHHVSISALYDGVVRLLPPLVTDIPSLQAVLVETAKRHQGQWLIATHWDETLLRERRAPTRAELDAAVPDRPVFLLHHTCHRALANSAALELAGIDRHTPEPSGGEIVRGPGGVPSGLLIERGMARVEELARTDRVNVDADGVLARMKEHYRSLARAGVTRVGDTAVPRDLLGLYRTLAARGDLTVPTHVCPVSIHGWLPEPTDVVDGEVTGECVAPNLWIGPVKLVFDGAPGCSMCLSWGQSLVVLARSFGDAMKRGNLNAIRTSFSISPRIGASVRSGISLYQPEDGARIVQTLIDRGFGVASHAIGNAAIDVVLGAYESRRSTLSNASIPRIEHATFAEESHARRMGDLGVAAVVQPAMLEMHMTASAARVPGLPFTPLARLARGGVKLVGSSDYPVHTFDPLAGIRAAVGRRNMYGEQIDPEECIPLDAAIAMYTRNAAEVLGCIKDTGTLTVGKRADFVVVQGLEEGAPQILQTFIGGTQA